MGMQPVGEDFLELQKNQQRRMLLAELREVDKIEVNHDHIKLAQTFSANLAKHLYTLKQKDGDNSELLELSSRSSDPFHRIAAAWYYGLSSQADASLFIMLNDEFPLVRLAARESCIKIAKTKFKDDTADFGPVNLYSTRQQRSEAVELWTAYFELKNKNVKKNLEEKADKVSNLNQDAAQLKPQKTVQQILGLKPDE